MLAYCDADGDGIISQAEADRLTEMDLTYDSEASDRSVIKSLDGIKIFRNLKNLECDFNALTSLDLSGMDKLEYLSCTYNKITSLNQCPTLGSVRCSNNLIEELLLPEVKKGLVTYVVCDGNRIKSLDLSSYPNLKAVNCGTNLLESLNVAGCSKIETLSCEKNCLTTLSLEGLAAMTSLVCSDNSIKELNVTESPLLEKVDAQRNPLESLWITAEQKSSIKEIKTDNNDNIVKVWRNAPVLTVSVAELAFGDGAEERKITYSIERIL